MASFKINIADPKTGKCYKTEIKDQQAAPFMGLNIGEKIEGSKLGIDGYEFSITGGTDYCGFPMRRGILGERKRITIYPGIGFKGGLKGMRKRKTVCGHKINDKISAINLKVLKEGSKKLSDLFAGEAKEEKKDTKPEKKPKAKEEKKEVKEAKPESKKEAKPEEVKKSEEKKKAPEEKKEEKK